MAETTANVVPLEPFVHQVSGHCCFMKFDDVSVCKPLNPREQRIYKDLPLEMRPFTPEYRGVVHVSFQEDKEGNINLVAHPSDHKAIKKLRRKSNHSSSDEETASFEAEGARLIQSPRSTLTKASIGKHRMKFRNGHPEAFGDWKGKYSLDDTISWPWYLQCQKRNLDEIKANIKEHKIHEYLILENITYHYHWPCVLDLKIGTQQHGDDASQEKAIRMMKKIADTTSSTLGVRFAGMQVYKRKTRQLIYRDKYEGMKLSVEGFKKELCNFLHDGERLAVELIQPFINKLQILYNVIEKQQSFRFFSSSLLLIYEGQEPLSERTCGKDFLTSTVTDKPEHSCCHSSDISCERAQSGTDSACCPRLDVRLIDFAHTTHSGLSEDRTRVGPDRGCLLGIRSTIQTLEEILKQHIKENS